MVGVVPVVAIAASTASCSAAAVFSANRRESGKMILPNDFDKTISPMTTLSNDY
jgi:hypothetical protein